MDDQIVRLEGAQRVRRRPAVIFGSADARGAYRSVELLTELLAEETAAHGSRLELTLLPDDTVVIRDDGRGIYFGEGDALWQQLFCQLFPGKAYEESPKWNIFEKPTDLAEDADNLVPYAAVCAAEHIHILSVRDGYAYALRFENGENVGGLQKTAQEGPSGTQIVYKPDPAVFSDTTLNPAQLAQMLRTLARQNPGLQTVFRKETPTGMEETVYCFPKA